MKQQTMVQNEERKNGAIVIGSSTGGPALLEQILPKIPAHFPSPIFVAQHLPASFITSFTQRLGKLCALPVKVACQGDTVVAGGIYFAMGGADTRIEVGNDGIITSFVILPNQSTLTPSIDALMESAAFVYKEETIGIILSGMGTDGLSGMRAIKKAGGTTIVQDEASSVVFGMGKEVVRQGLADHVLPVTEIIHFIITKQAKP